MIGRLKAFAFNSHLKESPTTQLSCFTPDNDPICHKDFGQRGLLCYDE
ncbi:hypothetical protein PGTDC60_1057 [Porphyromonas gingivalis TDC60]|nr:hypothetical protein PGTDC60_1057 [Porphyromonas gingivalis TDC60]